MYYCSFLLLVSLHVLITWSEPHLCYNSWTISRSGVFERGKTPLDCTIDSLPDDSILCPDERLYANLPGAPSVVCHSNRSLENGA